jgi:predicted nucleic-acid-binding Zn-ribbon protein
MEPEWKDETAKAKLNAYLAAKCNGCGGSDWAMTGDRWGLVRLEPDGSMILGQGSQVLPLRAMVCNQCGLAHLFDARVVDAGVFDASG